MIYLRILSGKVYCQFVFTLKFKIFLAWFFKVLKTLEERIDFYLSHEIPKIFFLAYNQESSI